MYLPVRLKHAQALLTKPLRRSISSIKLLIAEASMGQICCRQASLTDEVVNVESFRVEEAPEDVIMRHVCCSDGDLAKDADPPEIRSIVSSTPAETEVLELWQWGAASPKKCELMAEPVDMLRRRLISIAGAELELQDSQRAKAYADVLDRVLDVLASSMQFPAQQTACDLSDTSALMIVVAPREELLELVSTPQVYVLTQQPDVNNVHDDRFKTMLSQLCRSHLSFSGSQRRRDAARHVAVHPVSGEILATSAVFIHRSRDQFWQLSPRSQQERRGSEHNTSLSALEVATILNHGVVFAAFERGGLVVMPSVDVARGRAYRLAPSVKSADLASGHEFFRS